jgi:hypothetical protein
MKKEPLEVIHRSGIIYRDFSLEDADVRKLKAGLAAEIIKTLDKSELSVRKVQGLTGIDAGYFPRVRNADFRRISVPIVPGRIAPRDGGIASMRD